jgi:hypothetical protein
MLRKCFCAGGVKRASRIISTREAVMESSFTKRCWYWVIIGTVKVLYVFFFEETLHTVSAGRVL